MEISIWKSYIKKYTQEFPIMMYVSYDHYSSIWELIKYSNKYERQGALEFLKNTLSSVTSMFTKGEKPEKEKEREKKNI